MIIRFQSHFEFKKPGLVNFSAWVDIAQCCLVWRISSAGVLFEYIPQ